MKTIMKTEDEISAFMKLLRKEEPMQITDIKIRKFFDEGPMKAVVSVTFDDALAVHDIKVIYARERYFIVMPSRKNPDGTFRDIVHPINAQFRAELENAVIDAYNVQLIAYQENEEAEKAAEHHADVLF